MGSTVGVVLVLLVAALATPLIVSFRAAVASARRTRDAYLTAVGWTSVGAVVLWAIVAGR